MYTDRIDLSIPQEDIQSVLTDIASAAATLEFLPFINPSDRKHLAKLGLKNEGLTRKIIELARANQGLIPRDIEFEPIDRDLLARDQLRELKLVLEKLLGRVSDALMLTGVDLYAAALEMYHCLRRHDDEPGLRDLIDDVKKGFSRPSRKKKKQEVEPERIAAPAPKSVAQAPETEPAPSERAPAQTALATPPSEGIVIDLETKRGASISLFSPGAEPSVHVSTQPPPHIFSGGFDHWCDGGRGDSSGSLPSTLDKIGKQFRKEVLKLTVW